MFDFVTVKNTVAIFVHLPEGQRKSVKIARSRLHRHTSKSHNTDILHLQVIRHAHTPHILVQTFLNTDSRLPKRAIMASPRRNSLPICLSSAKHGAPSSFWNRGKRILMWSTRECIVAFQDKAGYNNSRYPSASLYIWIQCCRSPETLQLESRMITCTQPPACTHL